MASSCLHGTYNTTNCLFERLKCWRKQERVPIVFVVRGRRKWEKRGFQFSHFGPLPFELLLAEQLNRLQQLNLALEALPLPKLALEALPLPTHLSLRVCVCSRTMVRCAAFKGLARPTRLWFRAHSSSSRLSTSEAARELAPTGVQLGGN